MFMSHINVKAIMAKNVVGHGNPAPGPGESNRPGYYTSQRSLTVCDGGSSNTWVSGLTSTENPGGGNTTYARPSP